MTDFERRFTAMGTEVRIRLADVEKTRSDDAERALDAVQQRVSTFGRDAWAWGPGTLGEFNRSLAQGNRTAIPKNLLPLFHRAQVLCEATAGLFEPRIGRLVELWGFDEISHFRQTPPETRAIAHLVGTLSAAPPYADVGHYGPAPAVCWDFGGFGKGYIADLALDHLAKMGFPDALFDAGGNLAVRGEHQARPWRIGLRDPRGNSLSPSGLLAAIDLDDEAAMTHGDDQRFFEFEGVRYSHILDPRSGWPARGLRAMTVIHRDAALADAAGAAMFVAGSRDWPALAEQLEIDQVLAVDDEGHVQMTARMAARISLRDDLEANVI